MKNRSLKVHDIKKLKDKVRIAKFFRKTKTCSAKVIQKESRIVEW